MIIHATPVSPADRPRPFAFWAPAEPQVPTWSRHPRLWQRAIDLFAGGAPATRSGLVHRDFHPGNILWQGDTITGVIDWAETSWGPADLDVVHTITNFAMLHDSQSAEAFSAAYGGAAGSSKPIRRRRDSGRSATSWAFSPTRRCSWRR